MPQPSLVDTGALADELRELASDDALTLRRQELNALADDLRDRRGLAEWAEVDLLASFARPESLAVKPPPARLGPVRRVSAFLASRPWQRPRELAVRLGQGMRRRAVREDLVEGLLGVLVFVPLLITWFGLLEASRAYNELREEAPRQATRPFLQLWQSGFEGRTSALGRFDNVALLACLVIFALVLTALWHAWARAREERERVRLAEEREHLLGRLVVVLTRVQLALSTQLAASPRRFTGELSRAARRLESMVAKADDGQRQLAVAATAVSDATTALQAAGQRLADAATPLGSASDELKQVVRDGHRETARLSAANAAEMRAVGDRIGAMGGQIEQAVKDLTGVQRELLDSSKAAVSATDQASQAMVASSSSTDDAVRRMAESADRWDAAAVHWQNAADRLEAAANALAPGAAPAWSPPPLPPGASGGAPLPGSAGR
ncbi:hypothetical protein ACTWP5_08975 [Streptomyces sp. 4N509B]|uniref:hypothetical protein n=1 Tax=Streptomyces sp. 4N509B TaxID=3457413 RepID=UPI003FD35275